MTTPNAAIERAAGGIAGLVKALDAARIRYFERDLRTGDGYWPQATRELFGVGPEHERNSRDFWFSLIHPDDRESVRTALEDAARRGGPFDFEYRIVLPDGGVRKVFTRGSILHEPEAGGAVAVGVCFDVTRRMRAEAARDESERRLGSLAELAPTVLWEADASGRNVWMSRSVEELTGLPAIAMAGEGWRAMFHPDDLGQIVERWDLALATGHPYENQQRVRQKDGSWRWCMVRARPARDAGGVINRWIGSVSDVHDMVEADERLRLALDAAQMGEALYDLRSGLCRRSPRVDRMFGYEPGEAGEAAEHLFARMHPEDVGRVRGECIDTPPGPWRTEFRVLWPDGRVRWISSIGRVVAGADGRPERIIGMLRDVSEAHEAQEALRASEAHLQLGVAVADLGLGRMAYLGGSVDYLNGTVQLDDRAASLFDLPANRPLPRELVHSRFHPDDAPALKRQIAQLIGPEGEGFMMAVHRVVRGDGSIRWISARKRVAYAGRGKDRRAVSGLLVLRDATEEREREAALRASESRLQLGVAVAGLGLGAMDYVAGTVTLDERAAAMFALPADTPLPRARVHGRFHPDDARDLIPRIARLVGPEGDGFMAVEHRVVHPDGSIRWVSARKQVTYALDEDGRRRAVSGILALDDVTAVKRTQTELSDSRARLLDLNAGLERKVEERTREAKEALARLFETQKMETIGQLTGGVAHDFNNLLAAILSNLDLLRKRVAGDERALRLLDGAIQGAERGASLTRRLLAFARRQELRAESVSIKGLVGGMDDLLSRSLGPGIRVALDLDDDLPAVAVDPNQFELGLLNLAVNARDAMPAGGVLTISGRAVTVGAGLPVEGLAPGRYVRLTVSDTGVGMDGETLRRAVEPFFTTKGLGKGTGLGLSMVQGLAAQSGGALVLRSAPDRGTAVDLWLPQASGDAESRQRTEAGPSGAHSEPGRLAILVVDDDTLVSMGTAAMIEDLGHQAIEAGSGQEALAILTELASVDLVITDHGMPGMTGSELAARIRELRPELPVVLATGYADLPEGAAHDMPRLAKPFRQDRLAEVIAAAVGR